MWPMKFSTDEERKAYNRQKAKAYRERHLEEIRERERIRSRSPERRAYVEWYKKNTPKGQEAERRRNVRTYIRIFKRNAGTPNLGNEDILCIKQARQSLRNVRKTLPPKQSVVSNSHR